MMSTIIKIENLYKEYRLGVIGHDTLYRDLQSWWAKVRGKEDPNSIIGQKKRIGSDNQILALNKINLEIKSGEAIGIIGANGAGKSTLLKILSRVTAPTKGIVKIKGRIASLLEVGTGFHSELTGRENIYLNGAINGMTKREITKKLGQIVEFAGVERFIDTPVKRYSSGMHVRLGFAVAAHLDPEILVVDEVLAVGDANFQKKAISKMDDASKDSGRTVLFVSHNMDSIRRLCKRCILLNRGTILADGETNQIIDRYIGQELDHQKPEMIWNGPSKSNQPKGVFPGDELVNPLRLTVENSRGEICSRFSEIDDIYFKFKCDVLRKSDQMAIGMTITNQMNINVLAMRDNSRDHIGENIYPGSYVFETMLKGNLLNEGNYKVSIGITEGSSAIHIREANVVSFSIVDTYNSKGVRGLYPNKWPDVIVRQRNDWSNNMEKQRCFSISVSNIP